MSEERLNLYDADGNVVGAASRNEAKASGNAVGAVNVLLIDTRGAVLLQRRPLDKENGGRWDKSVGGHVAAGESFATTARREIGEELFHDPAAPNVWVEDDDSAYRERLSSVDVSASVVCVAAGMQRSLRDVRIGPTGTGVRNVTYHVAVFLGRTDVPIADFRPQTSEIDALAYHSPAAVDRLLLDGALAPNMAFVWLAYGARLLDGI